MSGFREKITPFTLGLSLGLLAACLFFIFKLDDYIRRIDFTSINQKNKVTEETVNPKDEKEKPENTREEKASGKKTETMQQKKSTDSFISVNNITDSSYNESETYRVLKEELQSVKNIYVKVVGPKEKNDNKDSLIASLAGVTMPDEKEFFMIEFWKTPLNSKGYKMTRSRLLIYGFNEAADLQLVKDADKYYLKNNNIIYSLSYSAEFKPLERANETEIAGKFN
ncbi:MAG TPA: hypothetical protein VNZ49_10845 [Bacteroidia bacterium]|nr:hypothetical protein [Bacteroidia bacterium]